MYEQLPHVSNESLVSSEHLADYNAEQAEAARPPLAFHEIIYKDDFVAREALEGLLDELQAKDPDIVGSHFVGCLQAFLVRADSVDAFDGQTTTRRLITSPPVGITVKSRAELNIVPYPHQPKSLAVKYNAEFLVRAGDIVEYVKKHRLRDRQPSQLSYAEKYLIIVADQLREQFVPQM